MRENFKKFIIISIFVHITLAAGAIGYSSMGGFWQRQNTEIHYIHLVKGTDENPSNKAYKKANGMPESTIREQDKVKEKSKDKKGDNAKSIPNKEKQTSKEVAKQKTSDKSGISPTKKSAADKKIEELIAAKQQEVLSREVPIEAAQVPEEGTGQSPNGTLDNNQGETDMILASYYGQIKKQVNDQWITTTRTNDGTPLLTQILILIDASGKIITAEYRLKSTDVSFDLSAMRAVERAAPFPVPPEAIKERVLSKGFILEFNPTSVSGTL